MNIAIDIRALQSVRQTGVSLYTRELVKHLTKHKKHTFVLFYNSLTSNISILDLQLDNTLTVQTKYPNKMFNLLCKLGLLKIDKLIYKKTRKQPNWIISPNPNFTAYSRKTKHALIVHDISFELFPECFTKKQRWWHRLVNIKTQCKKADILITPSKNTARDIEREYKIDSQKIYPIYPGISTQFRKSLENNNPDALKEYNLPPKYILYLGTIEPRKNIETLIQAFTKYKHKLKNHELVLAGPLGWEYKKILNHINFELDARYIGYVDIEAQGQLYKQATCLAFPSLYEGFGFPVLEAMTAGTPVITSNRSSLLEVGGYAAEYVDPINIDDIGTALVEMVKNKKKHHRHREVGMLQSKKFEWSAAGEKILKVLEAENILHE